MLFENVKKGGLGLKIITCGCPDGAVGTILPLVPELRAA